MNDEPKSNIRRWRVSRRGFLIGFGATTAVAAVGVAVGLPRLHMAIAAGVDEGAGGPGGIDVPPTSWFEISSDNRVRFFAPKVEMGQGVHTSMAQIAAEDLGVDWTQIEVVQAGTGRGFNDSSGTGNSNSVSANYQMMREAAATVRQMLQEQAAAQLGVASSALRVAAGVFTAEDGRSISYGDLVADSNMADWDVPQETPSLKPASEFTTIGKSIPRVDFVSKLQGKAAYGYDMRLPQMLYGAVARPPSLGATLKTAVAGEAASQPGVVHVVADDDFAGVVAESRQQALTAVRNMTLTWQEPNAALQQADLDTLVQVGNGKRVVLQNEGNAPGNLPDDALTAEYRTPLAAHAHLEPQAALVDVQPDKVTAWVSTQSAYVVRDELASVLNMDAEQIEVIPTYLGGGFGRKLNVEAAAEAARLSQAAGRPVHVGWTRTEDLRYGFFRPPTHHVLRGALDDNGRIAAITHEQASGDVLFTFFPGFLRTIFGADVGAYRGGLIQYDAIANRHTAVHRIELPIRTGPWRGLGLLANTFAIESFMDEMAHAASADPLQFRLDHLGDSPRSQRMKAVLQAAAERANWGGALPEGHALGIATSYDAKTAVAQVAEVSLVNGRVRVHNVTCAIDPGLVINPDGATAQTQGGIIMGLSSTLLENIQIRDGVVDAANFDKYPLLTMKEAPTIDVVLVESGDEPFGMGEPPIGPVAAAVANATFALTGQRLRSLPLSLG